MFSITDFVSCYYFHVFVIFIMSFFFVPFYVLLLDVFHFM